jgi:Transcription factor Pcc1
MANLDDVDVDTESFLDADLQDGNDEKEENEDDDMNEEDEEEADELLNGETDTPTTIMTAVTHSLTPPHSKQLLLLQYPYQCCMEIALPQIHYQRNMAKELQRILQVDPELTKQTYKVITTRCSSSSSTNDNDDDNDNNNNNRIDDVLVIHFYATQCKGLRVSISSFLEYIQVALKCYQEFA